MWVWRIEMSVYQVRTDQGEVRIDWLKIKLSGNLTSRTHKAATWLVFYE